MMTVDLINDYVPASDISSSDSQVFPLISGYYTKVTNWVDMNVQNDDEEDVSSE